MSFLQSVHEKRSYWTGPYSLKDPELNKLFNVGSQTDSGIVVTDELAMTCAAVYACVNVLSSDIAKAPLNLLKRRKDGGSDHYTDSRAYHLLKTEPNPEMGAMVMRQALTAHALTLGGGYAEIERNALDQPVGLWPIVPNRICRKVDERTGRTYYLVDNKTKLAAENTFHLHGLGYDGLSGYALLDLARQAVGLALATEKFASKFFGNNAGIGGVVGFDGSMDEEDLKLYREALESGNKVDRTFRLLLLDNGAKFYPYTSTNENAQMDELRDKQLDEVSRFYRVPPHKVNNLKRATFSNIEHSDLEYYKGPVLDWFTLWEQEALRKLVSKPERRIQYFKHNANVFLRGDITSRYTALGIARDKGIINADEWRDLEDMNPQDGEQGKDYLVQTAQTPAKLLTAQAEANLEKTKAETEKIKQPPPAPVNPAPTPTVDTGRAERAEVALAEVRTQLDAEIEKRAAAEAGMETVNAEVEIRRQAEVAASNALEAVRDQLEKLTEKATLGPEDWARLATAEATLVASQRDLDVALASLASATAELTETRTRETAISEQFHNLSIVEAEVRRDLASTQEAKSAVESERDRLDASLREQTERAELAEARSSAALAEFAAAKDDADALRATAIKAETLAAEATSGKAEAEAVAREARSQADAAIARASELEQAVGKAQADVAHATTAIQSAMTARDEARSAVETATTVDATVRAKTMAAHRELFVHIMRGAIERETDRARRAQQTPEKLRHWIETWYDGHAELMRAALLPAVKVHLAWLGDEADPGELVWQLVAEHVATSRRQLATVVNGDAEALAGSLAGLLRRWDAERVNEIPDLMLRREVAHGRQ
jgi:HK97 family phage portal protein